MLSKMLMFLLGTIVIWTFGTKFIYPDLSKELYILYNHGRLTTALLTALISYLSILSVSLLIGSINQRQSRIVNITIFVTSFICISNTWITQEEFHYQIWSTLLNNNDSVTSISFIQTYFIPLLYCTLLTLIFLTIHILLKPLITGLLKPKYAWTFFLASLIICTATVKYTNGNKDSFHPMQKIPSTYLFHLESNLYNGKRIPPSTTTNLPNNIDTHEIWLIVDESIRFDIFENTWKNQIENNFKLSKSSKYREIVSGAVCSDYANALLLVGMGPQDLPDKEHNAFRLPTLFDYAKSAGYATAWVNAYANKPGTYGYFNESAIESIDTVIIRKSIKKTLEPYEYDLALLHNVKRWAKLHPKTFIYVNKVGCHFPYSRYTPPYLKQLKQADNLSDYQTCIEYSVPEYLNMILASPNERRKIFYTSDHGQHLGENPAINLTHCARKHVHPSMASVPYVYISDSIKNNSVPYFSRPATHKSIFFDVLESIHPGYSNLYNEKTIETDLKYSSGDIFGRSPCYIHTYTPTERK